ncbi:hypothetical protein DQG23_06430 [Paenibacillus contaminans]|uniref:3D domain-containing protein n=2 Tax=Paenibacillus contaminans TaxID=450362 RepID=A0A329MS64_9BACL|nr:hypothetical protein DQG23_06430 [Paenibacillus contaminans]
MLAAILFVGAMEQAGAAGRTAAQAGHYRQDAAPAAHHMVKVPLLKEFAAGANRTVAFAEPGTAEEPNIAEMEESDLFANLDKLLDRFDTVEVVATGYSAGKESTGKTPGHPEYGITYSGVKVRKDKFSTIAADPKVFPLGTVLYIPGYGFGVVADTGSKIKGHKIDLYFKTKNQVYQQWGKKTVRVHVLIRGDGKVTEAMMDRLNALKTVPVEQAEAAPAKSQ